MIDNLKSATDYRGRHDAALLALEARWRHAISLIHPDLSDEAAELYCRALGDFEARIAVARAATGLGVAVKLRVILHHATDEGLERPHWLPLLQSALADLEGTFHAQ